jgi:hypothetical protein
LLTIALDASISAISTVEGAVAELYRPAIGQDPETAKLRHRGRGSQRRITGDD